MTGAEVGPSESSDERPLTDEGELLFRQVHSSFVDEGVPSSQAFKPTKKDAGKLSVSRSSKSTAKGAYEHHTAVLQLDSAGTWAVTVAEAMAADLKSFDDPLDASPTHAFIDFRGLGRGQTESRAKQLLALARERGCLHRGS